MKAISKKITSVLLSIAVTLSMMASFITISQISTDNNVYAGVTLAWPVPGHTNLSQGLHDNNAIDISDGSIGGATVVAAYGGTVKYLYNCTQQHYGSFGDCNGFGTGLVIIGDDGRSYQYAHMMANSIPSNVYVGAYVATGQVIGQVGTTGYSSGNHLHFGICYGDYWKGSGNPLEETYSFPAAEPEHTHSYGDWEVAQEPTCEEAGVECRICENCGAEETREIEALGHDYVYGECKALFGTDKYCYDECTRCGSLINIRIVHDVESEEDDEYDGYTEDDDEYYDDDVEYYDDDDECDEYADDEYEGSSPYKVYELPGEDRPRKSITMDPSRYERSSSTDDESMINPEGSDDDRTRIMTQAPADDLSILDRILAFIERLLAKLLIKIQTL